MQLLKTVLHLSSRTTQVLLLCALSWSALAEVKVLASIKPLALIANEVAGEYASVETLLPIAASPHDYALKVSDVRRLGGADLVVWVGKELEGFLNRPIGNLPAGKSLAVFEVTGLHWPEGEHDHHHHPEHDHQHDHHGHDHSHEGGDPHLWLDPRNAAVIAKALAVRLGELSPVHAEAFKINAERFARDMTVLDQQTRERLLPVKNTAFAVYHEGYQHFVERYSLKQVGYVTWSPEQRPGARHLHQLRQTLAGNARCLFTEPYYDQRVAKDLAKELKLKVGVLDPIGGEQVTRYHQIIETMATDFLTCLN